MVRNRETKRRPDHKAEQSSGPGMSSRVVLCLLRPSIRVTRHAFNRVLPGYPCSRNLMIVELFELTRRPEKRYSNLAVIWLSLNGIEIEQLSDGSHGPAKARPNLETNSQI